MAAFAPNTFISQLPPRIGRGRFNTGRTSPYCTHRNLTRLYADHEGQRCMVCHRVPDLGFLYRCTQDTSGNLPVSEFVDDDMAIDLADLRVQSDSANLATSFTASTLSSSHPTANSLTTDATAHTEETHDADVAVDEDLAQAYDGKRKFETAFPPPPPPDACNMKVCHACRPIYKDRSWQSLDEVVKSPLMMPPQYEIENRRLSNATTVMNIKLPSTNNVDYLSRLDRNVQNLSHHTNALNSSDKAQESFQNVSPSISHLATHGIIQGSMSNESASDADDEKGFAKEDTSDGSATDNEDRSATHSDREEFAPPYDLYRYGHRLSVHPQALITSDHNRKSPLQVRGDSVSGRCVGKNQTSEGDTNGTATKTRGVLSENRFYID